MHCITTNKYFAVFLQLGSVKYSLEVYDVFKYVVLEITTHIVEVITLRVPSRKVNLELMCFISGKFTNKKLQELLFKYF